jgi:hypothetical protein
MLGNVKKEYVKIEEMSSTNKEEINERKIKFIVILAKCHFASF